MIDFAKEETNKGVAKGGPGGPGPPQNPSGPPQNKSKTH
jgi:hypothetical protein